MTKKVLAECKILSYPDSVDHVPMAHMHDHILHLLEENERLNAEVKMLAESLGRKIETHKQKNNFIHIKIKGNK